MQSTATLRAEVIMSNYDTKKHDVVHYLSELAYVAVNIGDKTKKLVKGNVQNSRANAEIASDANNVNKTNGMQ